MPYYKKPDGTIEWRSWGQVDKQNVDTARDLMGPVAPASVPGPSYLTPDDAPIQGPPAPKYDYQSPPMGEMVSSGWDSIGPIAGPPAPEQDNPVLRALKGLGHSVVDALPTWDETKFRTKDFFTHFGDGTQMGLTNPDGTPTAKGLGQVTPFTDKQDPNWLDKFGYSFNAGVGGFRENLGDAAKWLGAENYGQSLVDQGQKEQKQYAVPSVYNDPKHEFAWKDLANPEFYATTVAQSLPASLSMMPLSLLGGIGGGAAATAVGLGIFGRTVLAALGGQVLSTPFESALEAGTTYTDALKRGMTEDQANHAANGVFAKNVATLGVSNTLELGTAFLPPGLNPIKNIVKNKAVSNVLSGAAKLGASGVMEGGEEALQDVYQRQAMGDPVAWDARMKEQFSVGALMGVGFGGAGVVKDHVATLTDNVKNRYDDKLQQLHDFAVDEAKTQGLSDAQAEQHALDTVAQTQPGKKIIQDAVDELKTGAMNEEIVKAPAQVDELVGKQNSGQPKQPGQPQFNVGDMAVPTSTDGTHLSQPAPIEDIQNHDGANYYKFAGSNSYMPESQVMTPDQAQQGTQAPTQNSPLQPQAQQPVATPLQEQPPIQQPNYVNNFSPEEVGSRQNIFNKVLDEYNSGQKPFKPEKLITDEHGDYRILGTLDGKQIAPVMTQDYIDEPTPGKQGHQPYKLTGREKDFTPQSAEQPPIKPEKTPAPESSPVQFNKGDKVFHVGTAGGHVASVIHDVANDVYTIKSLSDNKKKPELIHVPKSIAHQNLFTDEAQAKKLGDERATKYEQNYRDFITGKKTQPKQEQPAAKQEKPEVKGEKNNSLHPEVFPYEQHYTKWKQSKPKVGDIVTGMLNGTSNRGPFLVVEVPKGKRDKSVTAQTWDGKQVKLDDAETYVPLEHKDDVKIVGDNITFKRKKLPLKDWHESNGWHENRGLVKEQLVTDGMSQDQAEDLLYSAKRAVTLHDREKIAERMYDRLSREGTSIDDAIAEMKDMLQDLKFYHYQEGIEFLKSLEVAKEKYGEIDPSKKVKDLPPSNLYLGRLRNFKWDVAEGVHPKVDLKYMEWLQARTVRQAYKDGRFKKDLLDKKIPYEDAPFLLEDAGINDYPEINKILGQQRQDRVDKFVRQDLEKLSKMSDLDVMIEAIDSALGLVANRHRQKQIDHALATGGKKEALKVLTKEFRNGGSSGGAIGYSGFKASSGGSNRFHIHTKDGREFNPTYKEVLDLYLEHLYQGDAVVDNSENVTDAVDEELSKYGPEGRKVIQKAADDYNENIPMGTDEEEDPEEIDLLDENETTKDFIAFFENFYNAGREGKPMPEKQEQFSSRFGGMFYQAGKKDAKAPQQKPKKKPAAEKPATKQGKPPEATKPPKPAHPNIEKARDSLDFLKQAEEAARKRLKDRQNRVLSGLPMDDLVDYAIIGASKIAHKSLDYAEFASEMLGEFGDSLKHFMRAIHAQSQAVLEMSPEEIDEMINLASNEADKQEAKEAGQPAPQYADDNEKQIAELKVEIESIDNMKEQMINDYAKSLEQDHQQTLTESEPLFRKIKDRGGIAPSTTDDLKTEYKESVPLFLKNKNGLPLDEMAAELGMSSTELLDNLRNYSQYVQHSSGVPKSAREIAVAHLENDETFKSLNSTKGEMQKSLREVRSGTKEEDPFVEVRHDGTGRKVKFTQETTSAGHDRIIVQLQRGERYMIYFRSERGRQVVDEQYVLKPGDKNQHHVADGKNLIGFSSEFVDKPNLIKALNGEPFIRLVPRHMANDPRFQAQPSEKKPASAPILQTEFKKFEVGDTVISVYNNSLLSRLTKTATEKDLADEYLVKVHDVSLSKDAKNLTNGQIKQEVQKHLFDVIPGLTKAVDSLLAEGERPEALQTLKKMVHEYAAEGDGIIFKANGERMVIGRTGLKRDNEFRFTYNDVLKMHEGKWEPDEIDNTIPPYTEKIPGLTNNDGERVLNWAEEFRQGKNNLRPDRVFTWKTNVGDMWAVEATDTKGDESGIYVKIPTGRIIRTYPDGIPYETKTVWTFDEQAAEPANVSEQVDSTPQPAPKTLRPLPEDKANLKDGEFETYVKAIRSVIQKYYQAIQNDALPKDKKGVRKIAEDVLGRPPQEDEWSDALEAAIQRYAFLTINSTESLEEKVQQAAELEKLMVNVNRSLEKTDRQQFSTPLPIAQLVHYAADFRGGTVKEGAAGTGSLVYPFKNEANLELVELSPRRAAILEALGFKNVRNENTFKVSDIKADTVVGNPPFKGENKHKGTAELSGNPPWKGGWGDLGNRFIAWELKTAAKPGARLVFVTSPGVIDNKQNAEFRKWLKQNYTVMAMIKLPTGSYDTRSTEFGAGLIVLDNVKPTWEPIAFGDVKVGDWVGHQMDNGFRQVGRIDELNVNGNQHWGRFNRQADGAVFQHTIYDGMKLFKSSPHIITGSPENWDNLIEMLKPLAEGGTHARIEMVGTKNNPVQESSGNDGAAATDSRIRGQAQGQSTSETSTSDGSSSPGQTDRTGSSKTGSSGNSVGGRTGTPNDRNAGKDAGQVSTGRDSAMVDQGQENVRKDVLEQPTGESGNDNAVVSRRERGKARNGSESNVSGTLGYVPKVDFTGEEHRGNVLEPVSMTFVDMPQAMFTDPKYLPHERLMGTSKSEKVLSDVQIEPVIAAKYNYFNGKKGILIADDTGMGKTAEQLGIVADAWHSGRAKRILVVTTKDQVATESFIKENQEFDFGVPITFVNSETHKNFKDDYVEPGLLAGDKTQKAVQKKRDKAEKGGKTLPEYQPLPVNDGVIVMSKYTFRDSTYAVREWLNGAVGDVLVIMDESHDFSNVEFSQQGESARMLYESFRDKGQFVYASATAAENISNLEHLFGLKLWGTDDFGEFRARLAGQDPGTGSGGKKKQNKLTAGMAKGSVFSREIPLAMMEQIVRELKMEGQYVGRALSMEGVDMRVINASLTPKEIGEWNQAVEFIQMVAGKIEEHASDPKQRGRLNSQLVGYMRRISGYYRTKAVIAAMKERQQENPGQRFVLSGAFKSGDDGEPANLMAMINMIPDTEKTESTTGEVMEVINEEAVYDKEQLRSILRGENPEYGEKPVPELPSPIDALYEAFGEDKVLAIHGDVPAKERPQIVKMFQRGERPIVYFTSAGATGINLHDTIGSKIVFAHLDYPYDAKTLKQAEGRSNRTGQKTPPEYWYPVLDNSADPKFVGTILARYQAMGALSRGETAEMGGGEMGNYDFVGPIAQEAIYHLLPKLDPEIRAQMFGEWSNQHFTPGEERNDSGVREVVGEKVDPKKMLNAMMMLDYETGRDIYNQYELAMEEVRQQMESAGGVTDKFETFSGRQLDVVQGASGIKLRTIQTILSDQQRRRIDTQIAEAQKKVDKSQERLDKEIADTVTKLEERLAKYKDDYAAAETEAADFMKEYSTIRAANEKLEFNDPKYAENNRRLYEIGDKSNNLKRHMEQVRGKAESTQQQIDGFNKGDKDVIDTLPGVSRWRKELEHRKRQLAAAEDHLKLSDKAILVDGKFATNGLMVPIRDAIRKAATGIYGENPPTSAMKVELRGYYMEDGEKVVGAVIPTWASHAVGMALDARLQTDSTNADEIWSLVTSGMHVPLEGSMELRWMPKNKEMIVWGMKPRIEKRHREVFEQIKGDGDVVYNPTNNSVVIKTTEGLSKLIEKFPVKAEEIAVAQENTTNGQSVSFVEADNRYELHFDHKPDASARSRMKANGYRWDPKKEVWYSSRKDAAAERFGQGFPQSYEGGGNSKAQTFYKLKRRVQEGPKVDEKTGDKSVSRSQIIAFIGRNFKVPVGTGKYQGRARGIFKPHVTSIRTKNFGDFVAIAHELGHRLDKKFKLHEADQYWDELQYLVDENFANPPEDEMEVVTEGVADFTRLYLMDQAKAYQMAPGFFEHFESVLEENNLKGHMDTLVDMMDTWTGQSARNRVRGTVEVGKKKSKKVSWTKVNTWLFDELTGIEKVVRTLVPDGLTGSKNPFFLAWTARGVSGRIKAFLEFGPVNADGERIKDGNGDVLLPMKEILKSIDDLDMFRDYLVAQRALELQGQGRRLTPIAVRDAQQVIRETPQEYKDASAHLYAYQNATLAELVRSGIVSEETALAWKNEHFFYVPFNRVMEDTGERTDSGRGESGQYYKRFTNLANPVKRMKEKGSSRQIIDPLESIIKNTYIYISLAARNDVGVALADMVDGTQDSAFIMEKVKRPQMVTKFQLDEISKALEDAGVDMESVQLAKVAQVFRPVFMPSQTERILAVWKNGSQQFYQVRDEDLYGALQALDPEPMKLWVKIFSVPNNVLRTGITLSPTFIPKGPMRSVPTLLMQSDSYTNIKDYMQLPIHLATNFYRALVKDDKYYKWLSTGGGQSTLLSIEEQYMNGNADKLLKTSVADMLKNEWKFLYVPTAYKALRHLADTFDAAGRMSEYDKALEKTGDITTAAVRSRDVDMDFSRFGNQTRTLNGISLFFNVALQGPQKAVRTIAQHPVRTAIRGSLFITLPTLLLMALNMDDDEYWELPSWRRDLFWNIKMGPGKFFSIPIPFEWGLIFKTVPERLFGKMIKHDPEAFKDFGKNVVKTMVPSVLPTIFVGAIQWATEKNLQTGIPIVPARDLNKPAAEQYGPSTSEFSKLVGKVIDASPRKIDDLIKSYSGTLGSMGTSAADKFLIATGISKKAPGPSGEAGFFAKTFTAAPYGTSGKSVDKFYSRLDEMEKGYTTLKDKHPEVKGDPPAALSMMRQANQRMAAMRTIKDMVYDSKAITPDKKRLLIDKLDKGVVDLARVMVGEKPINKAVLNETVGLAEQYISSK